MPWLAASAACLACLLIPSPAKAGIAPGQVFVVYNSAALDAATLKDTYLAAHPDIPAANVLDLNDAFLTGKSDLTYTEFTTHVRDPIRNTLLPAGAPEPEGIIAIVLIRPFPHRVLDTDAPLAGDNGNSAATEINAGDATFAALDAELVLLWQDLDTGEAGGTMDSHADDMIDNPYHTSAAPIDGFSRAAIQTAKTLVNRSNIAWRLGGTGSSLLTPGDLYLVCRIDGTTLTDAQASIDRAQDLYVNRQFVRIILDEYDLSVGDDLDDDPLFTSGPLFLAGDDYEETRDLLLADGWDVRYDDTFDFIAADEELSPIIAYASYGENHRRNGWGENPPGAGTYIDGFRFPPGAMFNTFESFNGRAFNGLGTLFSQEQAADFITAGGTFAVGNVFEPFTFALPDNEFLFVHMLVDQMTWAEAAYTALPALSWQQIVLGDPLATAVILDDPATPMGDLNGDGFANGDDIALFTMLVINGLADYRAAFPTLDPIARADFTGDFEITVDDTADFIAALLLP